MAEHELFKHLKGITEIVINVCHGGFGLSDEAVELYFTRTGQTFTKNQGIYYVNDEYFSERLISRDDPVLIGIVKELGEDSFGRFAELKIVQIPADVQWQIDEYDGLEWVAEQHRCWH